MERDKTSLNNLIRNQIKIAIYFCCLLNLLQPSAFAQDNSTLVNFNKNRGQVTRFDSFSAALDAHDGEIALFNGVYYLYGTSYDCGYEWGKKDGPFCGFKTYSSKDLVNWRDEGFLFDAKTPVWQTRCNGSTYGCYRPHVIYNKKTNLYVLWINVYDNRVGFRVFTSATAVGPFTEISVPTLGVNNNANVAGLNNGDHDTFVDDDGVGYIAYTDWRTGGTIVIERLNDTYTSGTGQLVKNVTPRLTEAPGLMKRNGIYYVLYSDPNCGYCTTGTSYRTATNILGPWSAVKQISNNSCGGQPSFVSTFKLGSQELFLYGSDLWNNGAKNEALANFYWAPLTFAADGSINPLTCQETVNVPISPDNTSEVKLHNLDNTSGTKGFVTFGDIARDVQRSQSFVATRTGILNTVSFSSFQLGYPNAGLIIEIFKANNVYQPQGNPLSSSVVPVTSISWAPKDVIVYPKIRVEAGVRYTMVVKSSTTKGSYGLEYNDFAPYPGGGAAYSINKGASFNAEKNRTLMFKTFISPEISSNALTVFKDCGFSGKAVVLEEGNYNLKNLLARGISDNDISSLTIASGYEVELFELDNFGGASVKITANTSCLVQTGNNWNDKASSLKVRLSCQTPVVPYLSVNGGTVQQTNTAKLLESNALTLSPQPLTGGTWSWTGPNNFTSTSREISFASIGLNQAGAYNVVYKNASGCTSTASFNITVTPQVVATVYKDCNYGGYAVALSAGNYNLADLTAKGVLDNDISSLKINTGYEIQLYSEANFSGSTIILRADNSCLVQASPNWNDIATSLIIRQTSGNVNPTVSLTSPNNITNYNAPALIIINANASDSDGMISKVEFFNGSNLLGTSTTSPYSYQWNNVMAGTYTITAKATDNSNGTATSSAITITVKSVEMNGCSGLPVYVENGGYVGGMQVKNTDRKFECKEWPYSGWCNGAAWAYAPGVGAYWTDAWIPRGTCSALRSEGEAVMNDNLFYNAPNPFIGSTRLKIDQANNGHASVTVYTLTGELIQVVYDGYLSSGTHEFLFDSTALKANVYIAKYKYNDGVIMRRIMKME